MKKNLIASTLVLSAALLSSTQVFAFEKPNLSAVKSAVASQVPEPTAAEKTAIKNRINNINVKLKSAQTSVDSAFNSLVNALSSKEEAQKIKAELKKIKENPKLSAKEKAQKEAEIYSKYADDIKANQAQIGESLKNANAQKRTEIVNSILALNEALFKYMDVLVDVLDTISAMTENPGLGVALSKDLTGIKTTGAILKSNGKALKNVIVQAVNVAKIGGIKITLPKNTASKSKTSKVSLPIKK